MSILTKATILAAMAAVQLKTEAVPVPELGGEVLISEMSGVARDAYYAKEQADGSRPLSLRQADLIVAAAVDESGTPLFNDSDVEQLRRLKADILDRLSSTAARINGLTKGAQEEAAKNSEAAPSGASGSVLPPTSENP